MWYFTPKALKDKIEIVDSFLKECNQHEQEIIKYHNVVIKYGSKVNNYLIETINNNVGKVIDKNMVQNINFKFAEMNNLKEKESQKYLSSLNKRINGLIKKVEDEENDTKRN